MSQRVIFNLPLNVSGGGTDLTALVDHVPSVDEHVFIENQTYRVCKVLTVVRAYGGVNRARSPIVYLMSQRDPTVTEARYAKELSD